MGTIKKYSAPRTLKEVTRAVARGNAAAFAGGTDLVPRWTKGLIPQPATVVDLKHVAELRGVSRTNGEIRVGACTLMSELTVDPLIRSAAPILAEAAGRVACSQIRNRATIGGNLCNASPAADTAVPLILLDAVLDLASSKRGSLTVREVPITAFFRGPGCTVLAPGEILTCIRFKRLPEAKRPRGLKSAARLRVFAAWDKFGTRPAMEIAVASVGVALKVDDGIVTHARVGFGSVAPVPLRGRRVEAELVGNLLSAEVIGRCQAVAQDEITPITDVRASAAYRREMVGVMLRRMLERAKRA